MVGRIRDCKILSPILDIYINPPSPKFQRSLWDMLETEVMGDIKKIGSLDIKAIEHMNTQ